jgi:alkylation response protein AidB-like acyl-CoA dehydrogenase
MIQTLEPTLRSTHAAELVDNLRGEVESYRQAADEQRRLPHELAETLRAAGAFGLYTPRERGGLELDLVQALELYEAFGRIDASAAWNIWNGNIGFCAAMLSEAAADRMWSAGDPIIANSARPVGRGRAVDGGFVLSGRWDIVSAIDIADWAALFGIVFDGDQPRMTPHGPDVRVFFVPRADIDVLDTWHTTGMRGTGSKTVIVTEAFVPDDVAISPFAPARIDRPLYRIPAFTIASFGAAPIVVGVAQAALDEVMRLAPNKGAETGQTLAQRPQFQTQIGESQMALDAARLLLRDAAANIDAAAAASEPITELLRARLRAAMSHAATVSREVLGACQLMASSSAIYVTNPIERLVRDGMVALQHMILAPAHVEIWSRLALGLDAGTPIV